MSDEADNTSVSKTSVTLYAGFEVWRLKKVLEGIPDNAIIGTNGKSLHVDHNKYDDTIELYLD